MFAASTIYGSGARPHTVQKALLTPTAVLPRTVLRGVPDQQRRSVVVKAIDQANSVRIQVQGRHLEVTPALHDYALKKVAASIEPFKSVVRNVDVRFSVRGGDAGKGERQQRVELTVRTAHHGVIRAEVVKEDMYAAVDVSSDKLTRSLRKLKEKAVTRGNWTGRGGEKGAPQISDVAPSLASVDYDVAPSDEEVERATKPLELPDSVKRTKVFYLDEMTVKDAIDKLDQVDHDFYIYLDQDSGHVQVVYKRKEEGYGVIITVHDGED